MLGIPIDELNPTVRSFDSNPRASVHANPLSLCSTHTHAHRQESEPEMTGAFSSFHSQPNCHVLKIEMLEGRRKIALDGCVHGTQYVPLGAQKQGCTEL